MTEAPSPSVVKEKVEQMALNKGKTDTCFHDGKKIEFPNGDDECGTDHTSAHDDTEDDDNHVDIEKNGTELKAEDNAETNEVDEFLDDKEMNHDQSFGETDGSDNNQNISNDKIPESETESHDVSCTGDDNMNATSF